MLKEKPGIILEKENTMQMDHAYAHEMLRRHLLRCGDSVLAKTEIFTALLGGNEKAANDTAQLVKSGSTMAYLLALAFMAGELNQIKTISMNMGYDDQYGCLCNHNLGASMTLAKVFSAAMEVLDGPEVKKAIQSEQERNKAVLEAVNEWTKQNGFTVTLRKPGTHEDHIQELAEEMAEKMGARVVGIHKVVPDEDE